MGWSDFSQRVLREQSAHILGWEGEVEKTSVVERFNGYMRDSNNKTFDPHDMGFNPSLSLGSHRQCE